MSVFEICTTKDEVVSAVDRFENKIAQRDHSGDGDGSMDDAFKV
jgi:hypothetical protein